MRRINVSGLPQRSGSMRAHWVNSAHQTGSAEPALAGVRGLPYQVYDEGADQRSGQLSYDNQS
jgi:hypothetical protein